MATIRPFGHTDAPRFQYVLHTYRNDRPAVLLRETVRIDPPQTPQRPNPARKYFFRTPRPSGAPPGAPRRQRSYAEARVLMR
ncbi:MAG: hypothetical protein ACRD3C_20280 [Vicinamibacterales bacterium]